MIPFEDLKKILSFYSNDTGTNLDTNEINDERSVIINYVPKIETLPKLHVKILLPSNGTFKL